VISSPKLDEVLCEDTDIALWRGHTADGRAVLMKVLKAAHPTSADYELLRHEANIARLAGSDVAAEPEEVTTFAGHPALVLRDDGGAPLSRLVRDAPLSLDEFFPIALELTRATARVHARHLIHGELHPQDILVLRDDEGVCGVELLGFGRFDGALIAAFPAARHAATWPYLSPEQTGRLPTRVDERSDLYSIGILFYEMLAGVRPFSAKDEIGWIHAHCALVATSLHVVRPAVPVALSSMVEKLLAKPPEARYQSAKALYDDLELAFESWRTSGGIEPFTLARTDAPPTLSPSGRLHGRRDEARRLRLALSRADRVRDVELVLVSGRAGVGKTSLVQDVLRQLANAPNGRLVATGHCQRLSAAAPGAPLFEALGGILQARLESAAECPHALGQQLEASLGVNLPLLAALVPGLTRIVGAKTPLGDVPIPETKERLLLAVDQFVSSFSTKERPIVVVLDDLQWADAITLEVMSHWAVDARSPPLVVVGVYRTDEVGSAHPIAESLARMREGHAFVSDIALAPLALETVVAWIGDLFRTSREEITPLATIVFERTGGNPLFVVRFLESLHESHRVRWDANGKRWLWSIDEVRAEPYVDSVAQLLSEDIGALSVKAQTALAHLAAYGGNATPATVAILLACTEPEALEHLDEAFRAKLICRFDGRVRFLHDHIQQAAYAFLGNDRERVHACLGRALLDALSPDAVHDRIFEIVGQFELAGSALVDPAERVRVAWLELEAGRRAQLATHFASATRFLARGLLRLTEEDWSAHHELAFALHFALARSHFVTGELSGSRALGTTLLERARTVCERAAVHGLLAELDVVQGDFERAVDECILGLDELGIVLPLHPEPEVAEAAAQKAIERIFRDGAPAIDVPETSDPKARAVDELFASMLAPATFTDWNLLLLAAATGAEQSLTVGNTSSSALAYAALALHLTRNERYADAERLGRAAYDLALRKPSAAHRSRAAFAYAGLLSYLTLPIRDCLRLLEQERTIALAVGDQTFACFYAKHIVHFRFFEGVHLSDLAAAAEDASASAERAKNPMVAGNVDGLRRFVERLRAPPGARSEAIFDGISFDELVPIRRFHWLYFDTLQRFFDGEYDQASNAAERGLELGERVSGFLELSELVFYGALSTASSTASLEERLEVVARRHATLQALAGRSEVNFGAREALVGAELARLQGRDLDAERSYERAVHLARAAGQIHIEALASECAARFYRARGMHTSADAYLVQAHACFEAWGGSQKAASLARAYPFLADRTRSTPDIDVVLKAQRAISSTLRLSELHQRLLEVVLEHAGAQRACILDVDSDKNLILAATSGASSGIFGTLDSPATPEGIPLSMCRAAGGLKKPLYVADSRVENRWSFDPHFERTSVRSALCLPIVREDRTTALLYLENELTPRAFCPTALDTLDCIATQAAIALENARLYSRLEQENAERTLAELGLAKKQRLFEATLDAMPLVVFIKDLEGHYRFINRRFEEIFNFESSQLLGKTDFDLFPHGDAFILRANDRLAVQQDRVIEVDELIAQVDGPHFYRSIKFPLRDENDRVWAVCGIATDETSRKRADEELRRSLSLVEATIESTKDGILVFDRAGNIVRYNRRFCDIWGLVDGQMRGRHQNDLFPIVAAHVDDPPGFLARVDEILASPEREFLDTLYLADGRVFERAVIPQWLADRVVGRVVSLHDVTDRVRAAEERSRLLAEEKRARADAEEAVRARDEFLSIASHELRTPLASLSLAVETLGANVAQPIDAQRIRRSAAIAKRQVQRIVALVDMLLDVSRLRSGKLVLSRSNVDLGACVQEVATLLSSELARSGSELVLDLSKDVVGHWDPLRIEQVVTNLLTNAIKFGKGNPITVRLVHDAEGARLSVGDRGIGIPAEPRSRIFEPFTRLVSARHFGGLGLGLHISKTIVEAHGGTLGVESEEGVGSTFTVALPIGDAT
jgi:PAS domain S-box-containing protein